MKILLLLIKSSLKSNPKVSVLYFFPFLYLSISITFKFPIFLVFNILLASKYISEFETTVKFFDVKLFIWYNFVLS